MTKPSPDWMEIVRRSQRRWTDENPWGDAMTEPSPTRRQLDELLRAHGLYEECSIYSFAERLIDGIEEALVHIKNARFVSDPGLDILLAHEVLERLVTDTGCPE